MTALRPEPQWRVMDRSVQKLLFRFASKRCTFRLDVLSAEAKWRDGILLTTAPLAKAPSWFTVKRVMGAWSIYQQSFQALPATVFAPLVEHRSLRRRGQRKLIIFRMRPRQAAHRPPKLHFIEWLRRLFLISFDYSCPS